MEFPIKNICAYPWQEMIIDLTGEVVPCCFWSGYGNTGKPLGNTNLQSLDEIWNNEQYRELRRKNASGELDGYPCFHCMAYRWSNNKYPAFSWPVDYQKEEGHCYIAQIPDSFLDACKTTREAVMLFEDGHELPHRESVHDDIRNEGMGRYSVWGRTLYFSSSDNSTPITNGRVYELRGARSSFKLAGLMKDSLSGNNLLLAYKEYLEGKDVLIAKPSMISFISTSACNIECPACSQNDVRLLRIKHRPETEPDVLAHVPYLYQLIWHGGEPFLIKRFNEFIDSYRPADNPNLSFGFTTNGTLLNDAMLAKLNKFARVNASISVDSFNKETYEKIRSGAKFEKVLENTLLAVSRYNAPNKIFVVGMIVLKKNILELPENLRFAARHGIGLNLSPVVVYPVHERLDIFQDFKAQTHGWKEAIDKSLEIVREGKTSQINAFTRVDPEYMINELSNILDRAADRYAETFEVVVKVSDPFKSLSKMHNPGIQFLKNDWSYPLSYIVFDQGEGEYRAFLPRKEFLGNDDLYWSMFHDMGRPHDYISWHSILDSEGKCLYQSGWKEMPGEIHLEVPPFEAVPRDSNYSVLKENSSGTDSPVIIDAKQQFESHVRRIERDRAMGYGLIGPGSREDAINIRKTGSLNKTCYSNFRPLK